MKYGEWMEIWLENYVRPTEKQRTYISYSEIVRLRLMPRFGDRDMDELTPNEIQQFIKELLETGNLVTGKGLSSNSVNGIINVIQSTLRTAYNVGCTQSDMIGKIKYPKPKEQEVICFSEEEQKSIERGVFERGKCKLYGIIICLYTGLRIGELLALEWSDIDFDREIMTVSKSCHDWKDERGEYRKVIESPKTSSSKRNIPLPSKLVPILRMMRRQSESNYVIADREHTVRVRSYQRSYSLLLKGLGIPHKNFHSLRHTFATRAIECGMDVKTLSEILGHKSPSVTLKLYVHSLYKHKKEMMDRVGDLL